jgi:hypothetical protein
MEEQSPPPGGEEAAQPTEEELRAQIEEGLRKVRVEDVLLESVVTILNLSARRIAKEDERDLDQARLGIEAVRSLSALLPAEAQAQVRNALTEVQMLYARAAGEGPSGAPGAGGGGGEGEPPPPPSEQPPAAGEGQGGTKPPPGLWVPPGSS